MSGEEQAGIEPLEHIKQVSRVKHVILRKYLPAWERILGSTNRRLCYVDCYAGGGLYEHTGRIVEGSPLVAVQAAKDYLCSGPCKEVVVVLVEKDEVQRSHLDSALERVRPYGGGLSVHHIAEDSTEFVRELLQRSPNLAPTFFFIDPYGHPLTVPILNDILSRPYTEALITFMFYRINMDAGNTGVHYGRGVRLRGKNRSLKRSMALPEEGPHPEGLEKLETLYIYGWNADFVQRFREMLEKEQVTKELTITTYSLFDRRFKLPVPQPKKGYDVKRETWTVTAQDLGIVVDMTPRLSALAGASIGRGIVGASSRIHFNGSTLPLLDLNDLYSHLLEYKSARSYDNFYVPRASLPAILNTCEVRVSSHDLHNPAVISEAAELALRAYLDRFVSRSERTAESSQLELGYLLAKEQPVQYRVRTSSNTLYEEIKELLAKGKEELKKACPVKPLPRLHVDHHLYSPLLLDPESRGVTDLKVSPAGLFDNEKKLLEDTYAFWASHRMDTEMKDLEIFILRNLPKVGIGFFRRSGFYPDFIFWIRNRRTKSAHLRFLESHGMHHDGLFGANQAKIECLKELKKLSKRADFKKQNFTLDGFILTATKKEEIPGAEKKTWEELRMDHCLLSEDGLDAGTLFELSI